MTEVTDTPQIQPTPAEPRQDDPRGSSVTGQVGAVAMFLLLLAMTHFLVDTVAGILSPLWPKLQDRLTLGTVGFFWLYTAWQLATSVSQLAFGYLGDRFHGRKLLWLGPAAAIICISAIGLSSSPWITAALLVVGGLGIAAFHPEAAALAGASLPGHRSRAMALFAIGGYFGQAVGPTYSGYLTHHFGMSSLMWGIIGGLAALLILSGALSRAKQPHLAKQTDAAPPLSKLIEGRLPRLLLLLSISSMRVIGAIGVPLALSFLLDRRGMTSEAIGLTQSGFMVGVGLGGLACATWMRKSWELPTLLWLPVMVTPVLAVIPFAPSTILMTLAVGASGLLIGAALPVQISIGQQMLPEAQRVASSITMGVSWGIGSAIVAGAMVVFQTWLRLEWMFTFFAAAAALSALLSLYLPKSTAADKQAAFQ